MTPTGVLALLRRVAGLEGRRGRSTGRHERQQRADVRRWHV